MIATKDSFEPSALRNHTDGETDTRHSHTGRNGDIRRNNTAKDGHSSEQLPNSKKVFIPGTLHPDVRVPMREIELTPTKSYTGTVEMNEPVCVYDCSGPWGDPAFTGTVEEGLPAQRAKWIRDRDDVEEYEGREVKPQDNGYLSGKHAE